jgi:hypothetical protein
MNALIVFTWDGEHMVPMPRFARACDKKFVIGEYYKMDVQEERSWQSHKHYFASLHDGWANLPEQYAMEPWAQSVGHLRAYSLIKTGWHDTQTFACGTKAEAERWAARLRPMDDYAIVVAQGSTVTRFTAKSQAMSAMGKEDFQKSKDDVLSFVEGLLSVDRGSLGGRAA